MDHKGVGVFARFYHDFRNCKKKNKRNSVLKYSTD